VPEFDLVLENVKICDGSGEPAYCGSVALRRGKIVGVGAVPAHGSPTLDVAGKVVSPGFIDPHTHFDAQLVWDGLVTPAVEHGVTTVITGNCSLSLAPVREHDREFVGATFRKIEEMPKSAFDAGLSWDWETFDDYVAAIRPGLGVNVGALVGHSMLRLWVMGKESRERAATTAELAEMQDLLRRCIVAGAIGMSTSWVDIDHENRPVPARLASADELDALCAVLGEHGRVLQAVPEFWNRDLILTRIDMLADLSRKHGIATTFSPVFHSNAQPELTAEIIGRVKLQSAHGARVVPQMQTRPIDLSFDTDASFSLYGQMPTWWQTLLMAPAERRAAVLDPDHRARLIGEMEGAHSPMGLEVDYRKAYVKRAAAPENKELEGRVLGDLADERGCTVAEVILDISLSEAFGTSFGLDAVGHNDLATIAGFLAEPLVGIGAGDGGAHVSNFATYGDTCFLFSEFVRRQGAMSLEMAVRKLTYDVAQTWGLNDRGLIRPGYAADLVIFDPDVVDRGPEIAVEDLPGSGYRYIRRASGIEAVFVNGELVYSQGEGYSDARGGQMLPLSA
jgi:N-acyl-D-aspartate/D-glutamate deacylase